MGSDQGGAQIHQQQDGAERKCDFDLASVRRRRTDPALSRFDPLQTALLKPHQELALSSGASSVGKRNA